MGRFLRSSSNSEEGIGHWGADNEDGTFRPMNFDQYHGALIAPITDLCHATSPHRLHSAGLATGEVIGRIVP